MGVDIMETDVRKSRDGYLVMIHDDQVDRTTDGKGKVSQLTLAQLKALHLRQNEGGADAPLTDQTILTLDEILALSKGRIVLNLDVKDAIYAEVIDAVCRANAQDRVIVKTSAGAASQPLAPMAPYDRVPFMIIPMSSDVAGSDIPGIIAKQTAGPRKPVAIELPLMPASALPAIAERAGTDHVALWVNTLWSGFVTGVGGDVDALRMPEAVWGRLNEAGVTVFQTDEPEALIAFRKRLRAVKSAAAPASS
jgi:glycerophosphoryl diester phosphodiesterase